MTTSRIGAVAIALSIAFGFVGGAGPTQGSAKDQNLSGTIASSKRMADGKEWTTANLNVNTSSSYCYDDAEPNCRRYGRLYTWESAQRGCQSLGGGWRLPTDDEWRQLAKQHGGVGNDSPDKGKGAYTALLSGGTSGFNAVLGGNRSIDGKYDRLEAHGIYWTASENDQITAPFYNFGKGSQALYRGPQGQKQMAVSVRCVRDSASAAADGHAMAPSQSLTLVTAPRSGHWARYRTKTDSHGIDLYIAHDSAPKPLVVLLHGSGCAPLMTIAPDGALHDTSLFQDLIGPRLNRLHFVMIDKRGVGPLRFAAGMNQREKENAFEQAERQCSTEYMEHVTKQERVQDVLSVLRALGGQPWAHQLILLGHSEGTHVATGVLRHVQGFEITAAGLFASAGPIPFFGGYAAKGASADREAFRSVFEQVRQLQSADDDFMHQGLPARRWKTFWLASTPIEDVRESTVPLFVAQGSRDGSTLSADLFALEAIRQQPTRPLRYVVMTDGGHAFETPDGRSRLAELFDDFIGWGLDPKKQTAAAVLR